MDKEDVVYIYSAIKKNEKKEGKKKKNEIMPFAATWMDLEIMEVRKRKTNTI